MRDFDTALAQINARYQQGIAAASQATKELYAPLLARPREGIEVTRDLPYGPHARQLLDVYRPAAGQRAGVVVFLHGGAFVRGAKNLAEGLYGNVLAWFARHGFVGVNVEYRLAPEVMHPQGALDVSLAMQWVRTNIAGHGGDPANVLLIGHSAGGTHVASYLCDPMLSPAAVLPRAAVLISARLRADVLAANPNANAVRAYYGQDASTYPQCSPVTHAGRCAVPVMIACAEFDNPLLDIYALEFAHVVAAARGKAPRFLQCKGHNHMSLVAHFDSGRDLLGPEILAFWSSTDGR